MSSSFDDLLDTISTHFRTYKSNFVNQTSLAFSRLTPKDGIRLVIIAGAYCLLRPYIIKLGARFQERDHDRAGQVDMTEEVSKLRKADGRGNTSLKEQVQIPEDTDSEDDGEEGGGMSSGKAGPDWGKTARRRQRRVMRQLLEADEKRRREEEEAGSDKEIEDLLIG